MRVNEVAKWPGGNNTIQILNNQRIKIYRSFYSVTKLVDIFRGTQQKRDKSGLNLFNMCPLDCRVHFLRFQAHNIVLVTY